MFKKSFIQTVILGCLFSAWISVCAEEPIPQTDEDKKVYRKFHPDGVVEFSDQPTKGSEELKMETLPTYKFAPAPKFEPRPKQQLKPAIAPASPYTSLAISSPARNETIRANNGDVNVKFSLTPGLQTGLGHQIEYLLDGKSVLKTDQPAQLKNVSRGAHNLVIRIIDKDNKVLINSDSVTFYLLRHFKSRATPETRPKQAADTPS